GDYRASWRPHQSRRVLSAVVPQNVIRREMMVTRSAKATRPAEREPPPALPKVQHPPAKHGI
ncbi:MAG: hypothetical protein WBG86_05095, partial [Polyangiales bacterium]